MDYLRSCYCTYIRPYADSDVELPIQWYFCAPGAKNFPGPHSFGSTNWIQPDDSPYIGEVQGAPRPWRNGSMPAAYLGQNHCGTAAQFNGLARTTDPSLLLDERGVPLCCDLGQDGGQIGGLVWGGSADLPWISEGGLVWSGTALQGQGLLAGLGGLLWGGTSEPSGGQEGQGGVSWSGQADFTGGQIGRGGITWDGTAAQGSGQLDAIPAGLLWDGTAEQTPGGIGEGGLVWGGKADQTPGGTGEGGLVWGGKADQGDGTQQLGTGGLVWGGKADQTPGGTGEGGLVWGGKADQGAADVLDSEGGLLWAGSADQTPAGVGRGGLVWSGSADFGNGQIGRGGITWNATADQEGGQIARGGIVWDATADQGSGAATIGTGGLVWDGEADQEGGGGGGISVPWCDVDVPETLICTFGGTCANLAGVDVTLTYNSGTDQWEGSAAISGGTVSVVMGTNLFSGVSLGIACSGIPFPGTPGTVNDCDPVDIDFTSIAGGSCCTEPISTVTANVHE